MMYILGRVAIVTIVVYLLIGIFWLAMQVAPMLAIILVVMAFGVITAIHDEKRFTKEWREDMGYRADTIDDERE